MVGDSGVGYADLVVRERRHCMPKVWVYGDSMWGGAGTSATQHVFQKWQNERNMEGDFQMAPDHSFAIMQVKNNGEHWFWPCNEPAYPVIAPDAVGTGTHIAMPAMEAGFDPRYAVTLAARFDPNTSLPLDVLFRNLVGKEKFSQTYIRPMRQWYKVSHYTQRIVEVSANKFKGVPVD